MKNWSKKVHVQSSLESKPNQYAMFIGRWQPLHDGHVETTESNPFNAQEVLENIGNEYKELCGQGKVKVSIIPDICSVEFGRGVGYDIIEHTPPQEIHDISATKVREQMRKEGKL